MNETLHEVKKKLEHFGMDYYKRQTGRTTRMFEAAKAAADAGKPVTVLMKDEVSADHWRSRGWEVPGLEITHMQIRSDFVDWNKLKLNDHRANNVLFIDHDVFYGAGPFKHLLRKFTEYDLPVEAPEHVKVAVFGKETTNDELGSLPAESEGSLPEEDPLPPLDENLEVTIDLFLDSSHFRALPVETRKYFKAQICAMTIEMRDNLKAQLTEETRPKSLGNGSFLQYQNVLNQVMDDMLRTVSTTETDNPLAFCYALGQLKGKLLEDWKHNFGTAVAG